MTMQTLVKDNLLIFNDNHLLYLISAIISPAVLKCISEQTDSPPLSLSQYLVVKYKLKKCSEIIAVIQKGNTRKH